MPMIRHSVRSWMVVAQSDACRKGKSVPRANVYSNKNKILPLAQWKLSSVISLPLISWLITRGITPYWGLTVGLCCWLILFDWECSSGCSQVSLDEWKSILLSPCLTCVPVTMATLLMSPLGNDRGGCGRKLTGLHRTGHPIYLIIKILFCWDHPLMSIHMRHKYLHVFQLFREICSHTSSPIFSVTNFPIMLFSIPVHPACLTISPSKCFSLSQVHGLKFCPLGGFLFTTVLQRCLREGLRAVAIHFWVVPAYCAEPFVN